MTRELYLLKQDCIKWTRIKMAAPRFTPFVNSKRKGSGISCVARSLGRGRFELSSLAMLPLNSTQLTF